MSRSEMNHKNISREDILNVFPRLDVDINKGDMGRVLLVCGSYDGRGRAMCGAAYFCGSAAYRCGAGLAEIFTARKNYEALGVLLPEAIYSLYEDEEDVEEVCKRLEDSIRSADSIVIGCGLGKSKLSKELMRTTLCYADIPLVIDADGLNILSEDDSLWSLLTPEQAARTVITPHPGEMSRLTGFSADKILSDPVGMTEHFAVKRHIICLIKGHRTVISDGCETYINKSGNPGMASGGMGDILSGIIGALLARDAFSESAIRSKAEILYRVSVAAHLHGFAGDLAASELGEYSLTASELLNYIPKALTSLNK